MDVLHAPAGVTRHLAMLAEGIGPRPAGSAANRRATDYLTDVLAGAGLAVDRLPFTCTDWEPGTATLNLPDGLVAIPPSPFSRSCAVRAWAARFDERVGLAEDRDRLRGAIVVLCGELAHEPYFPKHFPFLTLPEQLEVISLLEAAEPAAVIGVLPPERPFRPLFEDADLTFPYATVTDAIGRRIRDGEPIELVLGGARRRAAGVNVSAGRTAGPRIVVSAHVDSKAGAPGALDNGGGVAVLLALVESGLLGEAAVELVFFNGEDHYAAPGEVAWLAARDLGDVRMMLNIDGVGARGRRSTVAPLACPPELEQRLATFVADLPGWAVVPAWYESDHAVFAMNGIPSLAFTSEGAADLAPITHTPADTLEVVDPAVLADVVAFVAAWLALVSRERLLAAPQASRA